MLCRTKNICSKIRTFPVWHQNLGSDLEREAGGCADKNFWTKQRACSPFLTYSPSSLTEFEICDEGYLLHTVHGTAQYMDGVCPHAVICSLSLIMFLFFCTDSVKLKSQSECATSPTDMMPIQQLSVSLERKPLTVNSEECRWVKGVEGVSRCLLVKPDCQLKGWCLTIYTSKMICWGKWKINCFCFCDCIFHWVCVRHISYRKHPKFIEVGPLSSHVNIWRWAPLLAMYMREWGQCQFII